MVLKQHGFNAICFSGEGTGTTAATFEVVRPYVKGLQKRFEHVVLFLDGDEAGINFTRILSQKLRVKSINLDAKCKDISDYQKINGIYRTKKIIKKKLSKCFKFPV